MRSFEKMTQRLKDELLQKDEYYSTLFRFVIMSDKSNAQRLEMVDTISSVKRIMVAIKKYKKKSLEQAEFYRSLGCSAFKDGDYKTALQLHTRSIMLARPKSRESCMAFENRSKIWFKMEKFNYCLIDIRHCRGENCLEEFTYKLITRQARCLELSGKPDEALSCYRAALRKLTNAKLSKNDMDKTRIKICNSIQRLQILATNEGFKLERTSKSCAVMDNNNDISNTQSIPYKSKALVIVNSPHRGNYGVASRKIDVGEVILADKANYSCLYSEFNLTHCHHCCRRLFTSVPCKGCSGVLFCGGRCRDAAWNMYHRIECKFLEFLEELGMPRARLALRIVITSGLVTIMKQDQRSEKRFGLSEYVHKVFDNIYNKLTFANSEVDDYADFCKLKNHEEDRSNMNLFKLTTLALTLLNLLKQTTFFKPLSSNAHELRSAEYMTGSHLLCHMMTLGCNYSHVADYGELNDDQPHATLITGCALYKNVSLLNHSCDPTAVCVSYNNHCVLKAIKPIQPGQEISVSYAEIYNLQTKRTRRLNLNSRYFFWCYCQACTDSWPVTQLEQVCIPKLKCPKCSFILTMDDIDSTWVCVTCKLPHNLSETRKRLGALRLKCLGNRDVFMLPHDEVNRLHADMRTYMTILNAYVEKPCLEFDICQAKLRMIFYRQAKEFIQYTRNININKQFLHTS